MPNKKADNSRKSPKSQSQPSNEKGGRLHRRWRYVSIVVSFMIAAGIWWQWPSAVGAATSPGDTASSLQLLASQSGPFRNSAEVPDASGRVTERAATPQERTARLQELKNQLALAEATLASYRAGTKYPQESRPASEHPDQIYPNEPVEELHAMRKPDGSADPSVQIKTSQTRIFVAGGEAVLFTAKAQDNSGAVLPLFVTRALARGLEAQPGRSAPQAPLTFADDGANGDIARGDGIYSALLVPATTGLATFNGTIRVDVNYNVGDRAGFVFFDIIYTPEIPATWTGSVREAKEAGSLNFYLKADIRRAGRYLVHGRVDDAQGKPFAFVHFNEILGPGPHDIKLTVFGKLIRDKGPAFPLRLRDVDGYLLKEDTDPDRALMPRLMGTVHVTKNYAPGNFSDAEWEGEERDRYLTELSKDVELAKEALQQENSPQASR